MHLSQLREQLADLKKKEAVAQTREQLLLEEKEKILKEISELYRLVKNQNIVPEESLTPENLSNVINKLQSYIDSEIVKSSIPPELL